MIESPDFITGVGEAVLRRAILTCSPTRSITIDIDRKPSTHRTIRRGGTKPLYPYLSGKEATVVHDREHAECLIVQHSTGRRERDSPFC